MLGFCLQLQKLEEEKIEMHLLLLSFAPCIPLTQAAYQSVPYQSHESIKASSPFSIQSSKFYNLPAGRIGTNSFSSFLWHKRILKTAKLFWKKISNSCWREQRCSR